MISSIFSRPTLKRIRSGCTPASTQLFIVHLSVSMAGRMKHTASGVRHMGHNGAPSSALSIIRTAASLPPFKPKGDNAAGSIWHIFLRQVIILIPWKSRIVYPGHFLMILQVLCRFSRVLSSAAPSADAESPVPDSAEMRSEETEWIPGHASAVPSPW